MISGLFLVLFAFVSIDMSSQQKETKVISKTKLKPDLRVFSVKVEREGFTASKAHRVKITIQIINAASFKTCDGPLKIKLEKADILSRRKPSYSYLGQAGVTEVCADPTSMKIRTETRYFRDTIPFGKTRKYKATVDSMDQVDESIESNNVAYSDSYAALSECDGVDVRIQWVEIDRTGDGRIFIQAHAKNVCDGSCRGDVIWYIDEDEAVPGASGISQGPMSTRVDPFQEFHTSGPWLGVMHTEGSVNTYTVRIEVGAPCSKSDSCRISLSPTERAPKRVTCH